MKYKLDSYTSKVLLRELSRKNPEDSSLKGRQLAAHENWAIKFCSGQTLAHLSKVTLTK